MSKKKSKGQKKKFFSHPMNKGKVFKKKAPEGDLGGAVLRRRGHFEVLKPDDFDQIPQCSHGPCLLFGRKENGKVTSRFFACAVHRNDETNCPFKQKVLDDGSLEEIETAIPSVPKKKWNYGCIPKKMKTFSKDCERIVFCRECNDAFENKHNCPCDVVTKALLRRPSRLLEASQNSEAQYFFSDASLEVLLNTIDNSGCDGVLCLGAPRIMESLKLKKDGKKLFMLDYDRRYAHFYPSIQYAQYSMLVDHFFDSKAEAKLISFMQKCSKLLLVCDPPFGVFMEPLMWSIQKLKDRYEMARKGQSPSVFFTSILVPLFVGKHILRMDNKFWMSDYKVTYDNHHNYAKPNRTTVRMYTDLPQSAVDLSEVEGYKFCDMCEKYVSEQNKHCFTCETCTSKDGTPHRHCNRCNRCVKSNYKHCPQCKRCHLQGRCVPIASKFHVENEEEEE